MDDHWLITFRSVTFGQKGESVLRSAGISCALRKTPKIISSRGCGYCLHVRSAVGPDAVRILQTKQIGYTGIYLLRSNGDMEELHV